MSIDANPPFATPGLRVGLFGGSFNPPHEGHRLVALECLKRLALDRVWVLVSPGNPLKDHSELAPLEARFAETVKIMDDPRIDVTAFEAPRGLRYTYETIEFLTGSRPRTNFVWIMGSDSLAGFHHWERWEEIARRVPLAAYARPGSANATRAPAAVALHGSRLPEEAAETLADRDPPAWVYLHGVMSPLSSTGLRKARQSPQ